MKYLSMLGRFVSVVLMLPTLFLLRVCRGRMSFEFCVYPGSQKDVEAYFPSFLLGLMKKILPTIFGLGYIGRSGLQIATMITADEAEDSCEIASKLHRELLKLARQTNSKIALAGRLPGIFEKHGLSIDDPFVRGSFGTVHIVTGAIAEARHRYSVDHSLPVGVIGGAGYVGSLIVNRLIQRGYKVIAFDPRYEINDRAGPDIALQKTADPSRVKECRLLLLITAKGDQIKDYIPYIGDCHVVLDDTHPQMPRGYVEQILAKDARIKKVALSIEGIEFHPRLHGFKKNALPGCLWEALVYDLAGRIGELKGEGFQEQDDFDGVAENFPYRILLDHHYEN